MPMHMIDTIVDMNHLGEPDFSIMAASGIVAVIHKATEGGSFRDPEYVSRKSVAKAAGLLWGSYHYVSGISVVEQLDNYVTYADPQEDELICIDYERSSSGPDMSIEQLERLVALLAQRLGRFPVVYGGDLLRFGLGIGRSEVLASCPLWYARYSSVPSGIPPGVWTDYALWQYTNGASGPEPHAAAGIGRCDRSRFNGTTADLQEAWPLSEMRRDGGIRRW